MSRLSSPLLPWEAPWGLLSPRFQNQSHGLPGWGWLWVLCAVGGGGAPLVGFWAGTQ